MSDPDAVSDQSTIIERPVDVAYPGIGVVRGIVIPDVLMTGTSFAYAVRIELDENIKHKVFHEAVIFLHVRDSGGQIVAALDFNLRDAAMAPDIINWKYFSLPATGIAPGVYHLDGGIYNVRTRLRYSFDLRSGLTANLKRRYFRWADLTIR